MIDGVGGEGEGCGSNRQTINGGKSLTFQDLYFKSFLEKRNAEDVQSLKFLTKMEAFVRNESNAQHSDPKVLKQNRQVLFKKIVSAHFNEDGDVLAISSGNVSDYLMHWTTVDAAAVVTEEDIKYLMLAQNDPTLVSEGLEPSYQKFISQISMSKLACLLSIL